MPDHLQVRCTCCRDCGIPDNYGMYWEPPMTERKKPVPLIPNFKEQVVRLSKERDPLG